MEILTGNSVQKTNTLSILEEIRMAQETNPPILLPISYVVQKNKNISC